MSSARESRAERWIPGLRVIRTYERSWLRADLLAGVVLAAILVPQGMAYAQLAGLPAVTGVIGMGAAKVAAGLFQGFAVFTSGSRTAVAEQSAAKSQVTGLVGAGLVTVL